MKRLLYTISILLLSTALSAQSKLNSVVDGLQRDVDTWVNDHAPTMQAYEHESDSIQGVLARQCHEIRLTLYSRDNLGFFDLTHELHRALALYNRLDKLAQPDNEAITDATRDHTRMEYLLETLRRMPPEYEETIEEISDSIAALESDTLLYALMLGQSSGTNDNDDFYTLTEEEQTLRDSCVTMARNCIREQEATIEILKREADNFAQLRDEFSSTNDYAVHRFEELMYDLYYNRNSVNLATLFRHPVRILQDVWDDCLIKFTGSDGRYTLLEFYVVVGEMFGMLALAILLTALLKRVTMPWHRRLIRIHRNTRIVGNALYIVLLCFSLLIDYSCGLPLISTNATVFLVYFVYVLTLQLSLLLRCAGQRATAGIRMYLPSILCGFFLIFMRMYYVPDSLLCLVMIPLTIGCWLWQSAVVLRYWSQSHVLDNTIGAITAVILLLTAILSSMGHGLLALQTIFWWESQQAAIVVIAALLYLMKHYGDPEMKRRVANYYTQKKDLTPGEKTAIQITWLYDLIEKVGLPLLCIASVPVCIFVSLRFFNAQEDFMWYYKTTFFSLGALDQKICDLSVQKISWVLALYFVFNYLRYVVICIYKQTSVALERKRSGHGEILTNQLNLTLGTNLINLIVWGLYITAASIILKIPMTALTVILGAFAGGIGFAMKDVVNNIIFGIQLMAGRLRVGDYIICDNYRGSVSSISYQTTQIVTEEGALVSFTNSDLFNKNFQNLTRHNPYEVNRVMVDVAYGSDIDKVERLIREAIEPLNQQDKFGRMLLSPQEGLRIEMRELAESGITMAVRFGVVAERRTWFLPVARKAIYQKLTENGIEIPFPQMDLHFSNEELRIKN